MLVMHKHGWITDDFQSDLKVGWAKEDFLISYLGRGILESGNGSIRQQFRFANITDLSFVPW